MKSIFRILLLAGMALYLSGCAMTRTVQVIEFPSEPWYEELEPFSDTEVNEWALFDMGPPNVPTLKDIDSNPFYDLTILFQ